MSNNVITTECDFTSKLTMLIFSTSITFSLLCVSALVSLLRFLVSNGDQLLPRINIFIPANEVRLLSDP